MLATCPREVWGWDITKLRGPVKWSYFHLYVILDIFSHYVMGWMIAGRETAELVQTLIADTIAKHGIAPGTFDLDRAEGFRWPTSLNLYQVTNREAVV